MHSSSGLVALAAFLSTASAATFGFNHGAQFTDDSAKTEQDFAAEFNAGKKLPGTNGKFTSARIYTMIQHGTSDEVIQAIPAAIDTNTHLLLGLWTSGDPANFQNEVNTLKKAIQQYPDMVDLVDGISVGSEDLYRISEIGLKAPDAAPGIGPDVLTDYISQVRDAIKGTPLSGAKIGHVDTWTAWNNESNSAVAKACDWIGTDAYPYFQDTMSNSIDEAYDLFQEALVETAKYSGDAEIWVTETGWAVSGPTKNLAKANPQDAETYWKQVACKLLADDNMNTWWYTLYDAAPTTPSPSFGILKDLNGPPAYDLSCDDVDTSTSTKSSSSTKTKSSSFSEQTDDSEQSDDSGSPGITGSGDSGASATATGGSYPIATGTGSGSGSNSSTTFVASQSPGSPTGGASAPASSSTNISSNSAAIYGASLASVFAAVAALFI